MDVLLITDPMFWVMRGPGSDHRRTKWRSHSLIALGPITQQPRQLGDIRRDPPRLATRGLETKAWGWRFRHWSP
jgi:hypothetical protein